MDVLVTGGTGFVGTRLCRELEERGHEVTALSRYPDDERVPEGVETAIGDVTAAESIPEAFEGKDAVVHLVALSPLFKPSGGYSRHFDVHLGGTENVVRAAEDTGIDHIVHMSALGADPEGDTAYIRSKGQAEEVVRRSEVDHTIVRPSVIFGEGGEFVEFTKQLTTPYVTFLPGGGETRFQPIWLGDLAPMLAACVSDEKHRNETYEVGGPEVLTLADVTRLVYRAEGKSVTVLPIPMPLAKLGMTLVDPLPFVPFGTEQYKSLKIDNTVGENEIDAFGVSTEALTTFGSYLGIE